MDAYFLIGILFNTRDFSTTRLLDYSLEIVDFRINASEKSFKWWQNNWVEKLTRQEIKDLIEKVDLFSKLE